VRYLRDIVDALAYAHAHGLVHRDVKPDNIIISGRHALVLDFGVAKAMAAAKEDPEAHAATLTQIGTSIGTPAYMAPEQAAGDPDIDHRADLYAAGVVCYEMLAGHPPFTGAPQLVLAAQISATPQPLPEAAPHAPASLARLVMRCLEKDPAQRHASADDLLAELESLSTPTESVTPGGKGSVRLSRRTLAIIAIAAIVLIAAGGYAATQKLGQERWVRTVAIPEIQRLADANRADSAFALATRAEAIVPNDSSLGALWPRFTTKVALRTSPPGARVSRTTYGDSLNWIFVGTTPTDSIRLSNGLTRYRIEAPGYRTVNLAVIAPVLRTVTITLDRVDSSDAGMVRVPGGEVEVAMPGLSNLRRVRLGDYFIDRHEVTNDEYKKFVDAGGYANASYWETPSIDRRRFVDKTGRPGPSTWEAGDFPAGQGDFPVSGVSWYEAVAYAKFAGKSLPTIYHWFRAATPQIAAMVIPGSNYGGQGPQRGSALHGMSPFGTFDMAGNVREWIANATGDKRFVFGGGWLDGAYSFSDAYAQLPADRSAINGIRLIKPVSPGDPGLAHAAAPVVLEFRDYATERPASDAVFEGFRGFFDYDRTALHPRLEYRDTASADWIRERVSYDAAYGGERMAAVMFIPKRQRPPYQALVFFPGSNQLYVRTDSAINPRTLDFLVKSGRMVVVPIYKAMFERNTGLQTDAPQQTSAYRDLTVMWVKDVRRTVDYLVSRGDVDSARIGYYGLSLGGRVSPPILAMEPRFKAAILAVAGLKMERARPEVDPYNFVPRIRLPVLMLNGKYDYYFPVETSQKPFFERLGTRPEDKRWVVFPEAHTVPRTELVRESLSWLDKYLGPTK
jgi:dienelactone hydrolase